MKRIIAIRSIFKKNAEKDIVILGLGRCGCNLVDYASVEKRTGCYYVAINGDKQALNSHQDIVKEPIDRDLDYLAQVARIAKEQLPDETRILILANGRGGSTGTPLATIFAQEARKRGILTLCVVTMPFKNERATSAYNAESELENLREVADGLLVIDNTKMAEVNSDSLMQEFFNIGNKIFQAAVNCIAIAASQRDYINADIDDLKAMFQGCGSLVVGYGMTDRKENIDVAISKAVTSSAEYGESFEGINKLLVAVEVADGPETLKSDDFRQIEESLRRSLSFDGRLKVCFCKGAAGIRITLIGTKLKK